MAQFTRTTPAPSLSGDYRVFRPAVRQDFQKTCAYCLIEELLAAGEANFELDHFFPRSRFPEKANDFYNLYYACHPCNKNKGAKWPREQLTERGIGFVDLCCDCFEDHYKESSDGTLVGLSPSALYTIDIIRLNNPHLTKLRRLRRELRKRGLLGSD